LLVTFKVQIGKQESGQMVYSMMVFLNQESGIMEFSKEHGDNRIKNINIYNNLFWKVKK
jgi:hypothetical protein